MSAFAVSESDGEIFVIGAHVLNDGRLLFVSRLKCTTMGLSSRRYPFREIAYYTERSV